MSNKVCTLQEAIAKYVEDGDVISFGGFTTNKKPHAAVREILRQGKKDFIAIAGPAGMDWDALIGENRVKAYINCYTADSGVTNVSRRFRSKIEKGELIYEDYSQDAIMLMLHAASLGLPFLPVRLMMDPVWLMSGESARKSERPSKSCRMISSFMWITPSTLVKRWLPFRFRSLTRL